MMLPLQLVQVLSFTASWLTFLGFAVGLYECWRFWPLRLFFTIMLVGYTTVYAGDIAHGKNPLVLIVPPDAPPFVYFWAPVVRQLYARWTILTAVYGLLLAYKMYIPTDDEEVNA